jgi:hypothetical protein
VERKPANVPVSVDLNHAVDRVFAETCQITNRNLIRGRRLQASGLLTAKPNRKKGRR